MVTLEDVAAYAGVSRATVSRVVNGDQKVKAATREIVVRAIAMLGYSPHPAARALASSHSNTLGLVTTSYRGGFFGALMDVVQTEAESQGKQLVVTQGRDSEENEQQAISRLFGLRCDGLILHVRHITDEHLRDLAHSSSPFVLLDRLVPGLESRCISFDHALASQLATQHLLDAGHRHIACISGPLARISARMRWQGFTDAMEQAGISPLATLEGDYRFDSGFRHTDTLLRQAVRPTAIYCCNEDMAIGALLAISEHRLRVPQDISLICYDSGERADFVRPALTSVHFPITDMAQFATCLLLDELSLDGELLRQQFTPKIISRDSVAPPPG
ncbi:galactose-inducible d-galactose regulon transcriptional repressor [Enterobacterales bacterium]|nr:galactose-inducible d-galactose regulon transcriptional repressor [Enterobacterales bacterium]